MWDLKLGEMTPPMLFGLIEPLTTEVLKAKGLEVPGFKDSPLLPFFDIMQAYVGNRNRNISLLLLLPLLISATEIETFARAVGAWEVLGWPHRFDASSLDNREVFMADKDSEAAIVVATTKHREKIWKGRKLDSIWANSMREISAYIAQDRVAFEGILAWLSTVLVGAFTAFESMATDMWVRAVNRRPNTLGANLVKFPTCRPRAARSSSEKEKDQQQPTIRLSELADAGFNVSTGVGDLLKRLHRVSFESVYGIESAYYSAFRNSEDKKGRPSNGLAALFAPAIADLETLEEIRNLILHRGGVVDQDFKDRVRPYAPALANLPLKEPLPVNGQMVERYASMAYSFCGHLDTFIADWFAKHPE